jgi:multidrug efflux system membrane fusion protein
MRGGRWLSASERVSDQGGRVRFALVLLLAVMLAGCGSDKPAQMGSGGPPATPVSVITAVREVLPVEVTAVGTVEPFRTVQVKSQVAGELVGVRFTEGGFIRQGDLLFEIDPRPYREALHQAEAAVAKDRAQLLQAEANRGRDSAQLKTAEADAKRYDELFKQGIAARNQYDQVRTTFEAQGESVRADQAAIESARASLESDRAAVERAKLDLSYCEIRSPLTGRAGNLLLHAGNYVKAAGDTTLVVINQIEPVFVSFGVPEEHLAEIRARSAGTKLAVEAYLKDDPARKVRGSLAVIDNTVDSTTGTIKLKAVFENSDRLLWPGQFVNTVLRLDAREATVVPAEAVQAGQRGQFVYVVKKDQTVEPRIVAAGRTVAGKVVLEKGVAPGETVVTDGQLRLYPGARIQAVPAGKIDSREL